MSYNVDFPLASSRQIEATLCRRLQRIRLARNTTQAQLASEAGVSTRTIRRMENGEGISLDTLIRVMSALGIQSRLESLLPDPAIRPIERVAARAKERKRARPSSSSKASTGWTWGDERSDEPDLVDREADDQ